MKGFGVVLATVAAVLFGLSAPASAYKADRDDEDRRHGGVGAPRRRRQHHRAVRRLARALRRPLRDHPGHARRGRRQRGRHGARAGARAAARERGPRRALPLRHGRPVLPRPGRLLLQHERAAVGVLLGRGGDAAADHADHPHDAAGGLHRLHAVAVRRPRPPPAGRPLHLGGRQGGRRPRDVPRAAARPRRARHVAGQEGVLRRQHAGQRRHDDRAALHDRLHARRAQHRRRRLDRLRLALRLAAPQRPGPAGRHPEDLGAGPPGGSCGLSDPEPADVHGHRSRPTAGASP